MSDISELMNRDPMALTKTDLTEIVEYFRKQRHLFKANVGKTPAKKKEKPTVAALKDLNIGELKL